MKTQDERSGPVRRRIFEIIQPDDGRSAWSRTFDRLITALILASVVIVFAATFDLPPRVLRVLAALEGVSWAQTLYVTDASLYAFSRVSCVLGKSATCAYAVVSTNFKLTVNGDVSIDLFTKRISASADEVFEIARIQPYSSTSSGTITIGSATYADDGRSFIGVRITASGM